MARNIEIIVKDISTGNNIYFTIPTHLPIYQLKEMIKESHPAQPNIDTQSIIFSGRVAQDNALLQDLFSDFDDLDRPQTFHLLIRNPIHRHTNTHTHTNQEAHQGQPHMNQNPLNGIGGNAQPGGGLNPQFFQQFGVNVGAFQQPGGNGPQIRRYHAQFNINTSLLVKLFVILLFLSQGSDYNRLGMFAVLALILYVAINQNYFGRNQDNQNGPVIVQDPPTGVIGNVTNFVVPFFLSLYPGYVPPVRRREPQEQAENQNQDDVGFEFNHIHE
eukprot:TRINITY_DN13504_c0_g1_i1.p1 TRINITY_DN13504_c0_g1~~TRINITY_DN13504_c0_g1_i1.p1  ORF type:complete len:285 (-),score=54.11 TRINITY_DN13504_c0_g1_i1:28-846(-)